MNCEIESSHDLLLNTLLVDEDDDGILDARLDGMGVVLGGSDENIASGRHIEIIDPDGSMRRILKSTFIWTLSESPGKLSSDRLKRVQGSAIKRKKLENHHNNESFLFKAETLSIGE